MGKSGVQGQYTAGKQLSLLLFLRLCSTDGSARDVRELTDRLLFPHIPKHCQPLVTLWGPSPGCMTNSSSEVPAKRSRLCVAGPETTGLQCAFKRHITHFKSLTREGDARISLTPKLASSDAASGRVTDRTEDRASISCKAICTKSHLLLFLNTLCQ